LEHEVGGESLEVASNRLVQGLRPHAVQPRQIPIEHDLLAAYQPDGLPDAIA
jgi:hypothetical protein